jgi:uncharacterized protein
MVLTAAIVKNIFHSLEIGDSDSFFQHVADNVDWKVMGTHPLAGHYTSKASFKAATFQRLGKMLPNGLKLHVCNIMVDSNMAAVELRAEATARNGMDFNNEYCWICRFAEGQIVEVRAYLDSALVQRLCAENE